MSLTDHHSSEQKTQLRLEALEQELKRLRKLSLKQSTKAANLRLSLYFQSAFFTILLIFLFTKGFIDLPQNHRSKQLINEQITDTVYAAKASVKDALLPLVYNTHKAALPKTGYDGILFAIQIGAYKNIDLSEYKENLLGLKQDTYDSINQFTLGEFIEYEKAGKFLEIVKNMGFEQAYIMSFKNGRRIHVKSALALREKSKNIKGEAAQYVLKPTGEHFETLAPSHVQGHLNQ